MDQSPSESPAGLQLVSLIRGPSGPELSVVTNTGRPLPITGLHQAFAEVWEYERCSLAARLTTRLN